MFKRFILFLMLFLCGMVSQAWSQPYYSWNLGNSSVDNAYVEDGTDTGDLGFADGVAITGAIGQNFEDSIRAELEVGYRSNVISSLYIDGDGDYSLDGAITAESLMSNIYLNLIPHSPFAPFIGVGIGVASLEARLDGFYDDTAHDTVLAYQFAVGGSVAIDKAFSFEMQYRYFATEDPNFNGLKTEYVAHSLFVGARFSF